MEIPRTPNEAAACRTGSARSEAALRIARTITHRSRIAAMRRLMLIATLWIAALAVMSIGPTANATAAERQPTDKPNVLFILAAGLHLEMPGRGKQHSGRLGLQGLQDRSHRKIQLKRLFYIGGQPHMHDAHRALG